MTIFHDVARAIDALAKHDAKRAAAKRKADESFAARWDAKRAAILDALGDDARHMVNAELDAKSER